MDFEDFFNEVSSLVKVWSVSAAFSLRYRLYFASLSFDRNFHHDFNIRRWTHHTWFSIQFFFKIKFAASRKREFNGKTCPFFIKKSVMIIDFWVLSDQLVDGPKNGAWTTDRIAPRRTWRIVKYLRWICRSHHYTGETNEGTRQHRNDHFSYIIPRRGRSNIYFHEIFLFVSWKINHEKTWLFCVILKLFPKRCVRLFFSLGLA